MDGALPSVVAGLTDRLVVAVPTSVGYGAAFEGLAALLTMLNACAPGVAGGNIDNGFGAGVAAARIARSVCSAVADGVGQQLVHRPGPEAARVHLDPGEAGDGGQQLGPDQVGDRAASTSTRATSPPMSRTRRFRTGSPASASAPAAPPRRLHPGQPLGRHGTP